MAKVIKFFADPCRLESASKCYVGFFNGISENKNFECPFTYLHGTLERTNKFDVTLVSKAAFDALPLGENMCIVKTAFGDRRAVVFKRKYPRSSLIVDIYDDESLRIIRKSFNK